MTDRIPPEWRDVSQLREYLTSQNLNVDYHGGEIVQRLDTSPDLASVGRAIRTGRCPHCGAGVAVVPDPPVVIETVPARLKVDPPLHVQHTSARCRELRYPPSGGGAS